MTAPVTDRPRPTCPQRHARAVSARAVVEQVALVAVHRRPVPRDPGRGPGRLGRLARLVATCVLVVRLLRGRRARHHRRLPPLLHARLVQGQPRPLQDRPGGRRQRWRSRARSIRWVADHRKHHKFSDQEGDPHSPWRYGDTRAGADQGPVARPHGLAVRRRADPAAAVRPRPAEGPRHRPGLPGRSRCCVARLAAAAGRRSAAWSTWSWQGALTAFFWAQPGPGRPAAPRHLVDQLDLPRRSASGRSRAATSPATSGGWRSCRWASPGTTCTTPTRPAPGTACSAARSTPAPG